ncbi:MAG: type II glyceraldehyde-3-phosphate dehydrogenase [Candidatus Njordarchaeia archaeon]
MSIKVAINGYGTIGKRIADAILKQDDMQLVGVTKFTPSYSVLLANKKGIPVYTKSESVENFENLGFKIEGSIEDLLQKVDLVVDASPSKVGAKNKELYEKYGVKAIFQGGEKENIADVSFSSLCNYRDALDKRYVRVVSCNTTGLCRLICTLKRNFNIGRIRVTLVRRAADPREYKKGPINAIVPKPIKLPSHHGPDVKSVIGDVDIVTSAVVVPTTIMHLHVVNVEMRDRVNLDDVLDALTKEPRILVIDSEKMDIKSTAQVIELARDLGRPRYDLYENVIWGDSLSLVDNELWLMQAIHQEAIVVPENIDAIRAIANIETDPMRSIEKTNKTLGIKGGL